MKAATAAASVFATSVEVVGLTFGWLGGGLIVWVGAVAGVARPCVVASLVVAAGSVVVTSEAVADCFDPLPPLGTSRATPAPITATPTRE
jgi:hypothetical protein